ncbi:MAG: OmpA family protein [Bacteroidales bacterium]|jgi:outer membrane protein OmpA-like peptidoglycan-associated protein/Tol biopolymer transport system component|nr:OmpA family protein [Bacteroidales bacterium]
MKKFFTYLFLAAAPAVQAQQGWESHNRERAKPVFEKAYRAYREGDSETAFKYVNKAIELYPEYPQAWLQKAIIYEDKKIIDSAILCYRNALNFDPDIFPNAYYTLGRLENSMGMYSEADSNLAKFLSHPKATSDNLRNKAELLRAKNGEALKLATSSVPFEPFNLGENINTEYDEYFPVITLDGRSIIITRRYMRTDPAPHLEEDFFISTRDSLGVFAKALRVPEPINSNNNEGAQSLSADGRYMFFSICEERKEMGFGSCDLWCSRFTNGAWSKPFNLGAPVNTEYWESQPSFSSDGRTLYFCSNRRGGYGSGDIWKTMLQDNGTWSEPQNLGSVINTSGMENSPFIHPDQKTLYFSSNGHAGLGGMDIFIARIKEDGTFEKPINIGFPINTYADEKTLSVNRTGDTAYFASDKLNGFGGDDIYAFALYEQARPQAVSYMKGRVLDAVTLQPLEAFFELINVESGKHKVESYSDSKSGEFIVALPIDEEFALNVSKSGYLFYSEHISLTDKNSNEPFEKDILLSKIVAGEKIVLNNVFFAIDKADLRDESFVELDKLVDFLKNNPDVRIEISGHTDNTGGEMRNQTLSQERAKAVVDYLAGKGIDTNRMVSIGYGSSKPVANNDTEDNRALNRRTEVKIL